MLLIENWAYLGSARGEEEIWQLLDGHAAQFDKDTYKILSRLGKVSAFQLNSEFTNNSIA